MKKSDLIIIISLLILQISCSENKKNDFQKIIFTSAATKPIGPYSQAVYADGFLFISGQIAIDATSGIVDTSNIENQTKKVMQNIKAILEASGMEYKNVVKSTIYITDMNNFATINKIYSDYFTNNFPARETIEVKSLPKNAKIEISMIAYKKIEK